MNIPKIFERKPKLVSNSVLHIILKRREKIESIRVFFNYCGNFFRSLSDDTHLDHNNFSGQ